MEEAAARRGVVRARRMELVRRPEGTPPFGARGARTCGIPGNHGGRRVIEVTEMHAERGVRTGWYGAFPESREERKTGEDDDDRDGRCPETAPAYGLQALQPSRPEGTASSRVAVRRYDRK